MILGLVQKAQTKNAGLIIHPQQTAILNIVAGINR